MISSNLTLSSRASLDRNRVNSEPASQSVDGQRAANGNATTSTEALSSSPTTTERLAAGPTTSELLGATEPFASETTSASTIPWNIQPVSTRVAELMASEGLSQDAATVIAMTERATDPADPDSAPTLDEGWRTEFAQMVSRSGDELATWAESQDTGAVTFIAGDNDIRISQRADGMVVVESSLDGVPQSTQIIDPSTSDRIVINAGSGDDQIFVDPSVTANLLLAGGAGQDFIYGGGGNEIIIGGSGDDLVRAGAGSDIVLGGVGNDNLEGQDGGDILLGQQGDDYLSGDNGNDINLGGDGQDTLYGGNDEDILLGQRGNDYLDAGAGNDLSIGGVGDDFVSGGKGDDEVQGNAGADTLLGASGADIFRSVDSNDTIIVDSKVAQDSISARVAGADVQLVEIDHDAGNYAVGIAGNQREEFVTRVEDDLETLRSLESGQSMLNALDQARRDSYRPDNHFLGINIGGGSSGHRIKIEELDGAGHIDWVRNPVPNNRSTNTENGFAKPNNSNWRTTDPVNNPARGTSATIAYNPSVNLELNTGVATPPVVVLFHEMAHAYNMTTGTGLDGIYTGVDRNNNGGSVNNFERQAVGLEVDHDNDPSTVEQTIDETVHPVELTENGFRAELGLVARPFY